MVKEGEKEFAGLIREALPNAEFRVLLEDGREVLATISGKMRMYRIRILEGDYVTVLMTPYDETRGRIVYRLKSKPESMKEEQKQVGEGEDQRAENTEQKEEKEENKR